MDHSHIFDDYQTIDSVRSCYPHFWLDLPTDSLLSTFIFKIRAMHPFHTPTLQQGGLKSPTVFFIHYRHSRIRKLKTGTWKEGMFHLLLTGSRESKSKSYITFLIRAACLRSLLSNAAHRSCMMMIIRGICRLGSLAKAILLILRITQMSWTRT